MAALVMALQNQENISNHNNNGPAEAAGGGNPAGEG